MTQTNLLSDSITIHPIPILKDNYVWMMINANKRLAMIVDPGEALPVISYLKDNKLTLTAILITHHHWDHTNGIEKIKNELTNDQHFDIPIFGHHQNMITHISHVVDEGDQISFSDFPIFKVFAIPGHTLKHLAFYSPSILFCGDTLFAAGCGRLFEGKADELYHSLQKLIALPPETKVYCAHEYTLKNLQFAQLIEPHNQSIAEKMIRIKKCRDDNLPTLPSRLAEEKLTNPFLRCHIPEVIRKAEQYAGKKLSNPIDVFATLRKWKDEY